MALDEFSSDKKKRSAPLPLRDLDTAMQGLAGTPKEEVDAEAKKEQRRKAKKKPKK